ncbi:MAG TPA: DUF4388 domain-containing protein [Blastocatellia bacterium]|nr:DUF4388 domain-containing protein [Blastocatellia bacterium]
MSEFDPESAIIDAELLVKYRMTHRAIETLERAIDNAPRHVGLREKLREILIDAGRREQAAQQCLALASLHISADDIERANERLLEAKRLDPRVSVTGQLRDTRRTGEHPAPPPRQGQALTVLSGNLAFVSLFDVVQILENSKLGGVLTINSPAAKGEVYLIDGLIVGAKSGAASGTKALGDLLGATEGTFEFEKVERQFDVTIQAANNTGLILDILRAKDEEEYGLGTGESF